MRSLFQKRKFDSNVDLDRTWSWDRQKRSPIPSRSCQSPAQQSYPSFMPSVAGSHQASLNQLHIQIGQFLLTSNLQLVTNSLATSWSLDPICLSYHSRRIPAEKSSPLFSRLYIWHIWFGIFRNAQSEASAWKRSTLNICSEIKRVRKLSNRNMRSPAPRFRTNTGLFDIWRDSYSLLTQKCLWWRSRSLRLGALERSPWSIPCLNFVSGKTLHWQLGVAFWHLLS